MAGEIQIMIPQYGELNRIYNDFLISHTFSFDRQKFITDFYKQYNNTKAFEAAILELVLDKPKEQYTLVLNSLRTEIEKNILIYEKHPLFDNEVISRVCYNFAGRYDADIKAQLEVTQKLSKPLNEAYNRYDSIGYRVHTAAEEKQAEKEYERCKAEYEKEKKELDKPDEPSKQEKQQDAPKEQPEYFDAELLSLIHKVCVGEQFEDIATQDFYANMNLYSCKKELKIKAREKIRVCYLIFLMSERLPKQDRDKWKNIILKQLDIDENYYKSKYKEPVSDFPSDSNQKFAKEMDAIFR